MEPTYDIGDIVVLRKGEPKVGDIVAYDPPVENENRPLVIHRIVGGDPSGWVIQGDNNNEADPWKIPDDRIVGVQVFDVPFAGQVLPYLTTPVPWAIIIGVAAALFLWPRTKPKDGGDGSVVSEGQVQAAGDGGGATEETDRLGAVAAEDVRVVEPPGNGEHQEEKEEEGELVA